MKVWNDAMCKIYKMSDQTETGDQISYNRVVLFFY